MSCRTNAPKTASTDAKNHVAAPSGATSTNDPEVGQQASRMLRSEGDASLALDKQNLVQVTDQPMDSDYHAMMAFMNEDVEAEIHTTADENAEQVFELWGNGRCEFFRRGERKTIKRYYADWPLRMKETKFRQREVYIDGVRTMEQIPLPQ